MIFPTCTNTAYMCCVATYRTTLFCVLELIVYMLVLLKFVHVVYVKMDTTCCDDDLDRDDSKGRTRGGVHRTAAHLRERCRHSRPSRPIYTPSNRALINEFVERGVECGPAQN